MTGLLKGALIKQKFCVASLIWSKFNISTINLCKIIVEIKKERHYLGDKPLINWLVSRVGPIEIRNIVKKNIDINDIKISDIEINDN